MLTNKVNYLSLKVFFFREHMVMFIIHRQSLCSVILEVLYEISLLQNNGEYSGFCRMTKFKHSPTPP